ncbi:MAG: HEAT repeat domain-containing protein [Planctomycetes bacterium]|nr:HEAT repeat domain-containing protein [Planctomycetota bacterium]
MKSKLIVAIILSASIASETLAQGLFNQWTPAPPTGGILGGEPSSSSRAPSAPVPGSSSGNTSSASSSGGSPPPTSPPPSNDYSSGGGAAGVPEYTPPSQGGGSAPAIGAPEAIGRPSGGGSAAAPLGPGVATTTGAPQGNSSSAAGAQSTGRSTITSGESADSSAQGSSAQGEVVTEVDPTLLWQSYWFSGNNQEFLPGHALGSPTSRALDDEVYSVFEAAAKDPDFRIRTLGALALGESAQSESAKDLLLTLVRDRDVRVRRTSALALGLLVREDAAESLIEIVRNEREEAGVRAYGAIGLGFSAAAGITKADEALQELLIGMTSAVNVSLASGVIIGVEIAFTGSEKHAEKLVPQLHRIITNPAYHYVVQCYAVGAIGKLKVWDKDLGLMPLVSVISNEGVGAEVRYAAIISLSSLYDVLDEKDAIQVISFLLSRVGADGTRGAERDEFAMNLSLIAIGKFVRYVRSPENDQVRRIAIDALGYHLGRTTSRSFSAIALGLAQDERAGSLLSAQLGAGDPASRGAVAVGLGLLGKEESCNGLFDLIGDRSNPELRGYGMLALGLIGGDNTKAAIETILQRDSRRPEIVWNAIIGLGLLEDDADSVDETLRSFLTHESAIVRGGTAVSVGIVRRASLSSDIVQVCKVESQDLVRIQLIWALNSIHSKFPASAWSLISRGQNYRAIPDELSDLLRG